MGYLWRHPRGIIIVKWLYIALYGGHF